MKIDIPIIEITKIIFLSKLKSFLRSLNLKMILQNNNMDKKRIKSDITRKASKILSSVIKHHLP